MYRKGLVLGDMFQAFLAAKAEGTVTVDNAALVIAAKFKASLPAEGRYGLTVDELVQLFMTLLPLLIELLQLLGYI